MGKFNLSLATVVGVEEVTLKVIEHSHTFKSIEGPFGTARSGSGFVRCRGKRFLGNFGATALLGQQSEVYYAPVFYFDGQWSFSTGHELTSGSGVGKLFQELEQFSKENRIECWE